MMTLLKAASTAHLLALAILILWIPSTFVISMTVLALDSNIETLSAETPQTNTISSPQFKSEIILKVARYARSHFIDIKRPNSGVEFLRDLKLILIIFWSGVSIISVIIVWSIIRRLHGPLSEMKAAIDRLVQADLEQAIDIQGSHNIRITSEKLEQLRQRLYQSEKQQTQFLRHISHEIKTPLTSIKEGSNLLSDELIGPINEQQREVTNIINSSTRELQASIENLLDYNSAMSILKVKQREMVDLSALLNTTIDKQTLMLKTKNLSLENTTKTTRAFVNAEQITTVFDNLLSNAIKFSPVNGTIKLWLDKNQNQVVFTIKDEGPGVTEAQRKLIFDAFYVGKQTEYSTLKGTGLGLSIARQYVELHQGLIETLPSNKGATFQVTLKT